jgi:hypothetical protein
MRVRKDRNSRFRCASTQQASLKSGWFIIHKKQVFFLDKTGQQLEHIFAVSPEGIILFVITALQGLFSRMALYGS